MTYQPKLLPILNLNHAYTKLIVNYFYLNKNIKIHTQNIWKY